jgi:hypothetical protein
MGPLLLAVLVLGTDVTDWLALRMNTVDSSTVFAHDRQSGVVVRYGGVMSPIRALEKLQRSPRLLARQSGKRGSYSWALVELSDPASDAKALVRDIGQVPSSGSSQAAVVDAYSPPAECDRELRYFVRKGKGPFIVFTTVPCNADQRIRGLSLLEAFMSESAPTEVIEREAFGPTGAVSKGDLSWLSTGPTVIEVLARIGTPSEVWPQYPDGFSLVYRDADAQDNRYAVDFTRLRAVARVRPLTPMTWAP